jgi:hypothetical protein
VRWHGDQVDVFLAGEFHDFGGGVAVQQQAAHVEAGDGIGFKGVEVAFGLFRACAVDIHQHGARDLHGTEFGVQGRQRVGEDELAVEVEGEVPGITYG